MRLMEKTFEDYIILLLSIVGSLASIWAFGVYFLPNLNYQGEIGVAFLGFLCLIFLFTNYYIVSRYRRTVRYATIFDDINTGFAHIHKSERNENTTVNDIIGELSDLCDSIHNAFSKVYNTEIGVCIKFIVIENNRAKAQTLVRDEYSKKNQRRTGNNDKTKHWIDANSDFEFIYTNIENDNEDTSYYYEGHLPICKDYKNTRLHQGWQPRKPFGLFENVLRRRNWPLKYRSTLVVPIVPLMADEQKQEILRGFLCIDSSEEGIFNRTIDVCVLKGISDGLYSQIDKLYKLTQNDGSKESENQS